MGEKFLAGVGVAYHTASRQSFKVTLDNDGQPKSAALSAAA